MPSLGAFDGTTEPPVLFMRWFRGYGEGWKKVWKWTLPVPGDGGGPVMVEATVVEARSWPGVVVSG